MSRFTRGVFTCTACDRATRGDDDSADLDLCSQCYELAGWDNLINDDGRTPDCSEQLTIDELVTDAVLSGGDLAKIVAGLPYLFPEIVATLPAPLAPE